MIAKQVSGGDYYVYHGSSQNRNWFLVKLNQRGNRGVINTIGIKVPKEFAGKRIRLKMEVMEDEN